MGIATLWIMLFHTHNDFSINLVNRIATIGYGGVDMFFFISGYSLYYLSKKTHSTKDYYKRRFIRIIPEFSLVILIICLIKGFSLNYFLILVSSIGFWLPFTKFPYILWFIPAILMIYFIFPFYIKSYDREPIKYTLFGIITGLLLCFVYFLFFRFESMHNLMHFFGRIPIFCIGVYFGMNSYCRTKISLKNKSIMTFVFIGGVMMLFYFIHKYISNDFIILMNGGLLYYPFIFITPFLCLLLSRIFEYTPSVLNKSIGFIGMLSLEIYLVHEFIFEYQIQLAEWTNCSSTIAYLTLIILSIVVAYMIFSLKEKLVYYLNKRQLSI